MKPLRLCLALATLGLACADRVHGDGEQRVGDECDEQDQCGAGATCFEQTCVGQGALRVSLAWERRTDFDLHVLTPGGHEIYWDDPEHETGELDVDDCVVSCRHWAGPHVENVAFGDAAEPGVYTVWVQNYDGRRSSDWWIEAAGTEGVLEEWDGRLPQEIGVTSEAMFISFE